ncbi:MAG: hypothetical protein K2K24_02545 [Clostridia bacterium]|nr:hypothetical protein [Clostridia bacterium]MDE6614367.1 hypothetical protein [Clostridia bacterium]
MYKDEKENCYNCAYFMQHYVKDPKGSLVRAVNYGHCCKGNRKHKKLDLPCELWQPIELQIEQRKKTIKGTLERIESLLENIALVLENDDI